MACVDVVGTRPRGTARLSWVLGDRERDLRVPAFALGQSPCAVWLGVRGGPVGVTATLAETPLPRGTGSPDPSARAQERLSVEGVSVVWRAVGR